jgi:hypothetical protein
MMTGFLLVSLLLLAIVFTLIHLLKRSRQKSLHQAPGDYEVHGVAGQSLGTAKMRIRKENRQKGIVGEHGVADILESLARKYGLVVLHDLSIKESKANIDHILVTSKAIYVIDAKNYKGVVKIGSNKEGKKVLRVGGYDRTNLAEKLKIYSEKVRESLEAAGIEVKVVPLLAFYKATFQKDSPVSINGVIVNFHGIENELFRNAKIKLTGEHPSIIASKILEDFPEKDA